MPLIAVLVGGLVGTALRLGIDAIAPPGEVPWSTLLINVAGAFLLGLLVARVWPVAPEWVRAGLGAGLLGSFTTFSAVAVAFVSLASHPDATLWPLALAFLGATLVGGLGAAWAGLTLGRGRVVPGGPVVPVEATE